jgi:hypothetical protein
MDKTKIENKLATKEEVAPVWPAVVPLTRDAINVKTSSDLVEKTKRHLELEAELAALAAKLRETSWLMREQEQAHAVELKSDQVRAHATGTTVIDDGTWEAPANDERRDIEAQMASIQVRLRKEELKYKRRQWYALTGTQEPNAIDRGLAALGLK